MRLTQEVGGSKYTGEVTPLPGCPDVAVSHAVFRMEGLGGFGAMACRKRMCDLAALGYSAVICTVDERNIAQRKVLVQTHWKRCGELRNKRTGHTVLLYMHDLSDGATM